MRTTLILFTISALILTVPAVASTTEDVAMLVMRDATPELDAALSDALQSNDPRVRAIAARVAAVRGRDALLPLVERVLGGEPDAEAARELVRATILLGGAEKIGAAIAASERFEHRLDTAVAIATARLGAAAALPAYERELGRLTARPGSAFFRIAFWGALPTVPKTADLLLARSDERGWRALMEAMNESQFVLDARSLHAALRHPSQEIRRATIDGLVEVYQPKQPFVPSVLKVLAASAAPSPEPAEIAFKRELLRRVGGATPVESDAWRSWLGDELVATSLERRPQVLALLTAGERAALSPKRKKRPSMPFSETPRYVAPPAFFTPDVLPAGAADAIMTATGCRGGWVGLGEVGVDGAGRVVSIEVSNVSQDPKCRKAVTALTKLALLTPTSIGSPLETKQALFVRSAKAPLCLDESPVPAAGVENIEGCNPLVIGEDSSCTPPRVVKRTELRHLPVDSGAVILEALVTETGCVRSARVIAQSKSPVLNGAALLLLSEWQFEPGTRMGVPVPTLFSLTINVRR